MRPANRCISEVGLLVSPVAASGAPRTMTVAHLFPWRRHPSSKRARHRCHSDAREGLCHSLQPGPKHTSAIASSSVRTRHSSDGRSKLDTAESCNRGEGEGSPNRPIESKQIRVHSTFLRRRVHAVHAVHAVSTLSTLSTQALFLRQGQQTAKIAILRAWCSSRVS